MPGDREAVARRVVSPDELDQLFRPHRPAVARHERSKQRLRAIARNRSPPPAHIRKQGQGDAHLASLEARLDVGIDGSARQRRRMTDLARRIGTAA
jgi:hypothetical protein